MLKNKDFFKENTKYINLHVKLKFDCILISFLIFNNVYFTVLTAKIKFTTFCENLNF